jgi:hypothetical protein
MLAGKIMPTTVKAAFAELLTRIELNPTRVELASQRYNAIKRVIESALPGKVVRQIGSFQRRTKIRPLDLSDALDVDALVSFGPAYNFSGAGENGVTPQKALQVVRSAISSNDIYKVMEPTTDAPVVVLEYADRTPFKIELAAGYVDKMGQHSHGQNAPECYLNQPPRDWYNGTERKTRQLGVPAIRVYQYRVVRFSF